MILGRSQVDNLTTVIFVAWPKQNPPGVFGLEYQFEEGGRKHYQFLVLSCRAGADKYFGAAKKLYGELRRKGILQRGSFKKVAL